MSCAAVGRFAARKGRYNTDSSKGHSDTATAVWPPPPSGGATLAAWFPFRFLDLRVKGAAPNFRGGWIGVEAPGIIVRSKIVTRSYCQLLIWPLYVARNWLPLYLWLGLLAAFALYILMLYLSRKPMTLSVPWEQVEQIVLDEKKQRVGIVYGVPDPVGEFKTYSLVFALNAALYSSFRGAVERDAPSLMVADKLRGESLAPLLLPVLNGLAVLMLAFLLSRLLMGHH